MESPARKSATMELLQAFDIDINEVAEYAQMPPKVAGSALRAHCMETCPVIVLIKVQTAAEMLLRQKGWRGEKGVLWQGFYDMLATAAADA